MIKQQIKDDRYYSKNENFNFDKTHLMFKEINSDPENIKVFDFTICYFELSKAFCNINKVVAMGFSDVFDKIEIWRKLIIDYYPECQTIKEVIDEEIKQGLVNLNGENNSKLGYKTGLYSKYTSGSRTLLRMTWFLKFLSDMFKNAATTDLNFSKCIKKSYEDNLAPHHSWLTRKGASLAMSIASGSKSVLYKAITADESDNLENKQKVLCLVDEMEKLYSFNINYLESKGLLNTP